MVLGLVIVAAVGAYLSYRLHYKREIAKRLAAIRAAGLPTTLAELNDWYRPAPGLADGTAVLTNAFAQVRVPAEALGSLPLLGKATLPFPSESLSDEQERAIAACLSTNQAVLALLTNVVRFQTCRYDVDMRGGYEALLLHIPALRNACRLLELNALARAAAGQMDEAAASLECVLGLADSLTNEPMLVSFLARQSCYAEASQALERVLTLGSLSVVRLRALEEAFARIESVEPLRRTLIGERCFSRHCFTLSLSELNQFMDQLNGVERGALEKGKVGFGLVSMALQGRLDRDQLFLLSSFDEYLQMLDLPHTERLAANEALDQRIAQIRDIGKLQRVLVFSGMLLPAMGKAIAKDARNVAACRVARVALAIELYRAKHGGTLPDELSKLAPDFLAQPLLDPFDGKPIRYRRLDQDYSVYSVDQDGVDNEGLPQHAKGAVSLGSDLVLTVKR